MFLKFKNIFYIVLTLSIVFNSLLVNSSQLRKAKIIHRNNNANNIKTTNEDFSSSSGSESSGDINPYISQYTSERETLVNQENQIKLGSNTPFNSKEQQANIIFSNILQNEELSFSNTDPSAVNFFLEKQIIENESTVFKIIQNMPKGSALHVHQDSSATYDYLILVGSYLPNCYIYIVNDPNDPNINNNGTFHFYESQPSDNNWKLLSKIRESVTNVEEFDQQLLDSLTLIGEDYGDYITLWRKFDGIFGRVSGLVTYLPIATGYMEHLFEQMIEDGVQHIEVRKCFGDFYDIDGKIYDDYWFVENMEQLVLSTRQKYNMSEFGFKIIGCNGRHSNQTVVYDAMVMSLELRNKYPSTFVGYDLVGPEDEGYPLIYFIDQFAQIKKLGYQYQYPLDYFFHAGETILYNNTNLYDAILLDTKRIGHGIQLPQHPLLMDLVLKNDIAIEICPISNQILQYVSDMRAHPGLDLLNRGLPVTISPDDPAIFNYGGLSYDFFEVTYSWGLNLQQLKQLAINSINHSNTFNQSEYDLLYNAWEVKWFNFIDYIINTYPNI
ncbi:hypothetical protein RB653_002317 [Dictyostelium firmibasis]|uniref:adenosine deaminase n=1 Tax=Dictyostelium firmibasis TaxID=79012 RepID=A0AAN7TX12_9MYCE